MNVEHPLDTQPLAVCSPHLPAMGVPPSLALSAPQSQQEPFFLLRINEPGSVHTEGMRGIVKDNTLAVHLVLMGEIPTHGDTSLLTPPICILTPLKQLRGTNKTSLVWFGVKTKPPSLCISVEVASCINCYADLSVFYQP